jgi:hypothetical protein
MHICRGRGEGLQNRSIGQPAETHAAAPDEAPLTCVRGASHENQNAKLTKARVKLFARQTAERARRRGH